MHDQSYSERSLWRLLAKGDRGKFDLGKSNSESRAKLAAIAARIADEKFAFSKFNVMDQSHGTVYCPTCTDDEFAIRKTNDNLKRHYSAKAADRNLIIPQVVTLLREPGPFHLVKLDIKKFFDNVDRDALLNTIFADSTLSYTTREVLRKIFDSPQLRGVSGLPRGLSVSSTLAEYCLKNFDSMCRQLPYIYFFTRYVDDMLFFCHERPDTIQDDVAKLLPWGLILNTEKSVRIDIEESGICRKTTGSTDRLSYLGYEFVFPTQPGKRVQISIPQRKINKLKTRVMLAIVQFTRNSNYDLLLSRFRFLSSNFRVSGTKQIGILYSGVYFNHRHIDNESLDSLDGIDAFVRRVIYSRKGTIGRQLYPLLSNAQRAELCSNSLRKGHETPKFREFTNKQLKAIKGAWTYA